MSKLKEENLALRERLQALEAEYVHDTDMITSLANHAAEDARYFLDAAAYRDQYHAGRALHVCHWCGCTPHADACPEKVWPLERPSRRGRAGRPSRILIRLRFGVLKGCPTCCGETFRCTALTKTASQEWQCKLAEIAGWTEGGDVLETTQEGWPKRRADCLRGEE